MKGAIDNGAGEDMGLDDFNDNMQNMEIDDDLAQALPAVPIPADDDVPAPVDVGVPKYLPNGEYNKGYGFAVHRARGGKIGGRLPFANAVSNVPEYTKEAPRRSARLQRKTAKQTEVDSRERERDRSSHRELLELVDEVRRKIDAGAVYEQGRGLVVA